MYEPMGFILIQTTTMTKPKHKCDPTKQEEVIMQALVPNPADSTQRVTLSRTSIKNARRKFNEE